MRPPSRLGSRRSDPSLPRGSALGVASIVALALGCDVPEARPARSALAPAAVVVDEPPAAVSTDALALAGEPAMAAGDPAVSSDAPAPAARRRFQAEVAEGRRLHDVKDFDGARAAFTRALDVMPGDPRTLSELGWASLFAGRLDEADAVLRQAEAAAVADVDEPRLLASILYNRGRVAEARGEPAVAIDAYQRSLRLRPHPATYEHLTAIPGGTRYVFGPEVQRLQGPYAKLGELCDEERRLSAAVGEGDATAGFECLVDATQGLHADAIEVTRGKQLLAPWRSLRFVETRPSAFAVHYHLALRIDDGWFVLPDVAALARGTPGTTESVTRLAALTQSLFTGGGAQVVLEVETRWVVVEDGAERESETNRVELLCGVGPSGIPSCTGALPRTMQAQRRDAGDEERTSWTVERRALPEGVVVLEGDPEALDEPAAAVLGAHRIAFL